MKQRAPLSLIFTRVFFLLFLLPQMSCTVIGFTIGAITDGRQPKHEKTIHSQEIVEIKRNALVTVYRKSLEPVTGRYRGTIEIRLSKDSTSTGILLEKKGRQFDNYQIPLEQIDHVYVPARKAKGKLVGLAVGFGLDLGVILIGLSSTSYDW